ncbi:MAG: hypothetical protein LBI06_00950 [Treponema sp.]|jgi:hypothetical protein|nr:hypothetical protein [Treponema sp.]
MKRLQGILIVLAIAMVLAACPPDPSSGSSPETLSLSGSVYIREINLDPSDSANLAPYKDAEKSLRLIIFDGGLGGSGKIENGRFSYSTGKPDDDVLFPVGDVGLAGIDMGGIYTDVSIQPEDANVAILNFEIMGNPDYILLTRESIAPDISGIFSPIPNITINIGFVSYIYADKNINIDAKGSPHSSTIADILSEIDMDIIIDDAMNLPFDIMDIPVELITQDIRLALKKGWNRINNKVAITMLFDSLDLSSLLGVGEGNLDIQVSKATGNVSISLGDPSDYKWVLNPNEDVFLPTD